MPLLIRRLLLFAPIAGLIALTNVALDPVSLFRDTGYEAAIADHLASGRNVTLTFLRGSERRLCKHRLQQTETAPDVLVLGSSRTMALHGAAFPGRSFVNLSVGGATAEDQVALTWLQQRGHAAPMVVLCADPWLLNGSNGGWQWLALETEYRQALRDWRAAEGPSVPSPTWLPRRFTHLLDVQYFRLCLRKFASNFLDPPPPCTPTERLFERGFVLRTDGSWAFPEADRRRTPDEIAARARFDAHQEPVSYLGGFTRLDPVLQAHVEALVHAWKRLGSRVLLFLAPYHPEAYRILASTPRYQRVREAESYFRALAAREGLDVAGSYDPSSGGFSNGDFYDGSHLREEALERLFRDLLDRGHTGP
jgi:hypothetical protein